MKVFTRLKKEFTDFKDFYEILIKFLAVIGAILVFFNGLGEFNRSMRINYNLQYYETKTVLLDAIFENVAKVISYDPKKDSVEYTQATHELQRIAEGKLILIDDPKLNKYVDKFLKRNKLYGKGQKSSQILEMRELAELIARRNKHILDSLVYEN